MERVNIFSVTVSTKRAKILKPAAFEDTHLSPIASEASMILAPTIRN